MNARANLVRPVTAKQPNSARMPSDRERFQLRHQLNLIRQSQEPITADEIYNLKIEKQKLIEEKTRLKTKIMHFQQVSHQKRAPARNTQILSSLDRQVKMLRDLAKQRRDELNAIVQSDRAARITELQEETKILHLELIRLKEARILSQRELSNVSNRLKSLNKEYSDSALQARREHIIELERQVQLQTDKNNKLRKEIKKTKEIQDQKEQSEENQKMQAKINSMREKIKTEQKEIEELENQITEARNLHAREVQEIQAQCTQKR